MARTTSFTSSPRARSTRVIVRVGRRVERMVDQSAVRTLSARSLASAGSSRAASKAGSPPSFFASLAVAPASANAAFSGFEMRLGVGAPRVERCSRSSAIAYRDGTIYGFTDQGQLFMINAAGGKVTTTPIAIPSAPAYAETARRRSHQQVP